jgi:hypothetical protein
MKRPDQALGYNQNGRHWLISAQGKCPGWMKIQFSYYLLFEYDDTVKRQRRLTGLFSLRLKNRLWPQPHFQFFTFGKTAKVYQAAGGFCLRLRFFRFAIWRC